LHAFVTRRRALAARYAELLADLPLTLPSAQQDAESAWHLYPVRVQLDALHSDQAQIFSALRAAGIGVNLHYIPVHLQPFYRQLGFADGDFPEAERYYRQAMSLPLYPDMTDEQQEQVVQALISVLH
jgi:dTDP-4-amino-4,6-dideoxygalactose transaminase